MSNCPCGSEKAFDDCCGPFLGGALAPPTAEALLRSRYTAYTRGEIDYIRATTHPSTRGDFDEDAARRWSKQAKWVGLKILRTEAGGPRDKKGTVEFIATFAEDGRDTDHHEVAEFGREDDAWRFVDGKLVSHQPFVREAPKVGRNDPCPCGSGKKFKKCCGK